MTAAHPDPLYYLRNFTTALSWISERYADLLVADEHRFISTFAALPVASRALLVRLIMRKGPHFRATKIVYAEIGCIASAAAPLIALNWLDPKPLLALERLFRLATREELNAIFPSSARCTTKSELFTALQAQYSEPRTFEAWRNNADESVFEVLIAPLCTRLRWLFFGSFYQQWSEFVLADLGIFKYESIELSPHSRAFQTRDDIEHFFRLYECRERLHNDVPLAEVLQHLPDEPLTNEWLEGRRAKLLFQVAHRFERQGELEHALLVYQRSRYPNARLRTIRIMERIELHLEALECAERARTEPASEAERHKIERVLHRLQRRLGKQTAPSRKFSPNRIDLVLPAPASGASVERIVSAALEQPQAPVFYVENSLVNSLFGMLCWDAIFAPVRGAFFHRFHSAPLDLLSPEFYSRRRTQFDTCLRRLDSADYADSIKRVLAAKQGIQSPFVSWGLLSNALLDLALSCIPAVHLRRCAERILADLRENCTGLPDLIQFWPAERRYRMIEVKGPGDRLQDNQKRWLEYCRRHELPVVVAYVQWTEALA